MPFTLMDHEDFVEYSRTLCPTFTPYSGARLMSITARNCYIPSLLYLKYELTTQLTSLSQSLVINLDPLTNIAHKSFVGCTISFVDARYYAIVLPVNDFYCRFMFVWCVVFG